MTNESNCFYSEKNNNKKDIPTKILNIDSLNTNKQESKESKKISLSFKIENGQPGNYTKENIKVLPKVNYNKNFLVEEQPKNFRYGLQNTFQKSQSSDLKLSQDTGQKINTKKQKSVDYNNKQKKNDMKRCKKGLKNKNNVDFLNSIIQSFIHLRVVYNNFMNNKIDYKTNQIPTSYAIFRAILHLYDSKDSKPYNLSNLYDLLIFFNPMFKGDSQKDPIDVLIFILNLLNDELKKKNLNNLNNPWFPMSNKNKKEELIKFWKDVYLINNKSFISEYFCWINAKEKVCGECNNKTYAYQYFYTLDLDYKNVYNSFVYQKRSSKIITIDDCLNYQLKKKTLFNNYCSKCKKKVLMTYSKSYIFKYPQIFIFVVKDFVNEKEDITIKFEEDIFINKTKYELKSIVAYENKDQKNGKYISYCQDFSDKNWYCFKDEEVSQIKLKDHLKIDQKKTVPLIFFYEQKH